MKSQIQDFFHLLKRFVGRVDHKGIQIQIPLKFVSVETAVRVKKHFQKTVDTVYRVKRVLAVSKPFQLP